MDEVISNVHWLAVAVGAAVAFTLGWLWYGPLFGKAWMAGVGLDPSKMTELPVPAMVAQALGTFFLAWVFGVTAKNNALWTVILVTVTIAALIAAGGLYVKKSQTAISIEVGYVFAMAFVLFLGQALIKF